MGWGPDGDQGVESYRRVVHALGTLDSSIRKVGKIPILPTGTFCEKVVGKVKVPVGCYLSR